MGRGWDGGSHMEWEENCMRRWWYDRYGMIGNNTRDKCCRDDWISLRVMTFFFFSATIRENLFSSITMANVALLYYDEWGTLGISPFLSLTILNRHELFASPNFKLTSRDYKFWIRSSHSLSPVKFCISHGSLRNHKYTSMYVRVYRCTSHKAISPIISGRVLHDFRLVPCVLDFLWESPCAKKPDSLARWKRRRIEALRK